MPSIDMNTKALSLLAAFAGAADAFWRMPCSGRLALERADPIISPGQVSGHVHTISGGNGFGFSMDYDQARNSSCSSCPIKQDLSNYWTPKLYYLYQNGSVEDVPQAGESNGNTGGMTVYYEQRLSADKKVPEAFPEGFRMVAGDPFQRNYTGAQAAPGNAVSFVCLDYSGKSPQTNAIPNTNCPDGLRAQVYFPSCWDGRVDSPDHKSHVAYPIGANTYDNGDCPSSHPRRLISLFFEVIYNIDQFSDRWYNNDAHPFVFAQGDRTGYGFHGDFVNGWDVEYLQDAVNECNADSGLISDCPVFNQPDVKSQQFTTDEQQACRIPPSVDESVTGILNSLPGCNTPTDGPEYAPPPAVCGVQSKIGLASTYFTDVTKSLGWSYVGCGIDDYYSRTFTGARSSGNMTVENCISFCKSKGFSLAGLEYANECYCDNDYQQQDRAPKANVLGGCEMTCSGDSGEICGGSSALSIYKACDSGACDNSVYSLVGNSTSSDSSSSKTKRHLGQHRHGHLHHES